MLSRKYSKKCIRRRMIRRVLTIFIIGLAIAIMTILLCGAKPQAVGYDYISGTSLWEIAGEHCPGNMDKRVYINEVMKLNGMDDCTVYANRLYQVPVYAE